MSGNGRGGFNNMTKKVIIIGGGPAGMQAALSLAAGGLRPVIVERSGALGGKLRDWHRLFPSMTPAAEVLGEMTGRLAEAKIDVMLHTEVETLSPGGVTLAGDKTLPADAVIIASGFDIFDARLKEEYGYHVYDNVYTTVDIERMLNHGKVALHGLSLQAIVNLPYSGATTAQSFLPSRLHCCSQHWQNGLNIHL